MTKIEITFQEHPEGGVKIDFRCRSTNPTALELVAGLRYERLILQELDSMDEQQKRCTCPACIAATHSR